MALKVENLTRENCELRARNGRSSTSALSSSSSSSSAPTAGDKALRRDYELVTAEKDRLMKLIEQLKHEKKQLVETVLHLSNEVDAAHKSVDQLATDRMRHVQTDAMIRSARRRLGLQIIGVLEARGVAGDDPLMKVRACMRCLVWSALVWTYLSNAAWTCVFGNPRHVAWCLALSAQEIRAVVSSEEQNGGADGAAAAAAGGYMQSELDSALAPLPPPLPPSGAAQVPYVTPPSSSSQRLDAESLRANEEIYRLQQAVESLGLGTGHALPSPSRGGLLASTLSSRSRSQSRSGSVNSRDSRRRSRALERDDNESMISSVSTHRSGRSHQSGALASGAKRKVKSQITAENLAILNRLNGDDDVSGGDGGEAAARAAAAARARQTTPTPTTSRRTKTTEEAPAASWWPRLF